MARKKLKPGIHYVNVKGKRRKVKVLANGQWRFMKMPKSSTSKKTKRKTTKRKVKRKVAKRKKKTTRRKGRAKLPLSVINGSIVSIFAPPNPGWASTMDNIQAGNFVGAAQSFMASWTGLRLGGIGGQEQTEIDIMGVINPFDMRNAPAAKTMLWTKLATKITKKLAGNPFTRIPFVKDYISFS